MYIIKDSNGDVVAITSRFEDARAFAHASKVDKTKYKIFKDNYELTQKTN